MDDRLAKLNEKAKHSQVARRLPHEGRQGPSDLRRQIGQLGERVASYFQAATKLEHKKSGLLELIVDFEVIQTESEVEALLAENRLIKDIQPRYNARLLDDKTYPYLMITADDEFPGVYVTRVPQTQGAKLYGPFTSVYALKEAVTLLQKAFKFRTCHLEISEADDKRRFFRPCLLYPIKQCTAPCAAKISRRLINEDIGRLIKFLDGGKKTILRDLEKDMIEASEDLNFERAAPAARRDQSAQRPGATAPKRENRNSGSPRLSSTTQGKAMIEFQQCARSSRTAADHRRHRHRPPARRRDSRQQSLLHRRRPLQGRLSPLQDQARPGQQRLPEHSGSRQPALSRSRARATNSIPDVILIDGGLGSFMPRWKCSRRWT